jgi:hypothetical protein
MQGPQTQFDRRATFQSKNALRAAVLWKKAYAGHTLFKKLSKQAKFVQKSNFRQF